MSADPATRLAGKLSYAESLIFWEREIFEKMESQCRFHFHTLGKSMSSTRDPGEFELHPFCALAPKIRYKSHGRENVTSLAQGSIKTVKRF